MATNLGGTITNPELLELRAFAQPWGRTVGFVVWRGRKSFAIDFTLRELDPGVEPRNIFSLDYEHAQTLIDDLWRAGLRPTEGTGSAGAMAAVQEHLKDLRRLVFDPPRPSDSIRP